MKGITITGWTSNRAVRIVLISIAFFIFSWTDCSAQNNNNYGIDELAQLFKHHEHEVPKYSSKNKKPKNELEFLMATGFNTYKKFFSSQDNPSCVFHPSCSVYSVQALQQKGLLVGTLYTFDRLSRCHRFIKTNQYIYDPSKQRFYDPVK